MINSKFLVGAAVAALLPVVAGDKSLINVYWGQLGGESDRLINYCTDPSVDIVTIGFVNVSPENAGDSGYPGSNFAAHCAAEVYSSGTGVQSQLLSNCHQIRADIPACQAAGTKVLIGIGGDFIYGSNYTLSSVEKGLEFGEIMWKAFGPYDETWDGPRPFDQSSLVHTSVDGFDFDIEEKFADQTPWIAMINYLREQINASENPGMIITAAPQCPISPEWFQMKETLEAAVFDRIFIQYYNNRPADCGTISQWVEWLSNTPNKDAKIHIGRAAHPDATGALGGYFEPEDFIDEFCPHVGMDYFGGISLWDAYFGATNLIEGEKYYDLIAQGLAACGSAGGDEIPVNPSISSTASSIETLTSSESELPDETIDVTIHVSPTAASTSTTDSSVSTAAEDSTSSEAELPEETTSVTENVSSTKQYTFPANSSMTVSTETLTSTVTGTETSTITNEQTETVTEGVETHYLGGDYSTTSSTSFVISTVYTTKVTTTTMCPEEIEYCVTGLEVAVTETVVAFTTICPADEEATATYPPNSEESEEEEEEEGEHEEYEGGEEEGNANEELTTTEGTTTTHMTTKMTTTIFVTRSTTSSTTTSTEASETTSSKTSETTTMLEMKTVLTLPLMPTLSTANTNSNSSITSTQVGGGAQAISTIGPVITSSADRVQTITLSSAMFVGLLTMLLI